MQKNYIFIFTFLLGVYYIEATEYRITPENLTFYIPDGPYITLKAKYAHFDRDYIFPLLNDKFLNPDNLMLLFSFLSTPILQHNNIAITTPPFDVLLNIFTFKNIFESVSHDKKSKILRFIGFLDDVSIKSINNKSVEFPDFTVKPKDSSGSCILDVFPKKPISESCYQQMMETVIQKLKKAGFVPDDADLPMFGGREKIKNKVNELIQFSVPFNKNNNILLHPYPAISLFSHEKSSYDSYRLGIMYINRIDKMVFSNFVRSFHRTKESPFTLVELINEEVTGGGDYPLIHDETKPLANNHRILIFENSSKNYDDSAAIQIIQLPMYYNDECPFLDKNTLFALARFDVIGFFHNTLVMHDKKLNNYPCFAFSKHENTDPMEID